MTEEGNRVKDGNVVLKHRWTTSRSRFSLRTISMTTTPEIHLPDPSHVSQNHSEAKYLLHKNGFCLFKTVFQGPKSLQEKINKKERSGANEPNSRLEVSNLVSLAVS